MRSAFATDIRTTPNLISLTRLALLPAACAFYFNGRAGIGLTLAVIAALTDYLDGAVARATGQVTRLGEILDQFCDVCFESVALTVGIHRGYFPLWIILVYLFRELWVLAIRRYLAEWHKTIPSSLSGKLKTNFLMWGFLPTFLSLSGALPAAAPILGMIGHVMITIGLVLSYVSGWGYTRAFFAGYESGRPAPGGKSAS